MAVSGGGAFAMNTGSVFGNVGTFSGNLTSGGTFNVGNAVNLAGKMAVTGNYAQTAAGTLKADIGGTTEIHSCDLVDDYSWEIVVQKHASRAT